MIFILLLSCLLASATCPVTQLFRRHVALPALCAVVNDILTGVVLVKSAVYLCTITVRACMCMCACVCCMLYVPVLTHVVCVYGSQ